MLSLTHDDCVELYYALETHDVDLAEAIGPDGCLLAAEEFTPTDAQLITMRDAVQSKLATVKSGFYGKDTTSRRWARHLADILESLRLEIPHPQTDEHLAACVSCMMAHDKALPDDEICECGRRPEECSTFDGDEQHGDR